MYDFEAYLDKTKARNATVDLVFENQHTAISVSIGDTLDTSPKHIVSRDPKKLVGSFVEDVERRAQYLRQIVRTYTYRKISTFFLKRFARLWRSGVTRF